MQSKKERKEFIVKIHAVLREGIKTNNKQRILDAYQMIDELMMDHGVFMLNDTVRFPE
jgi:hypothetical protein